MSASPHRYQRLGRWWWTVDRWSLLAVVLLMGFGAVPDPGRLPPSAGRIGSTPFIWQAGSWCCCGSRRGLDRRVLLEPAACGASAVIGLLPVPGPADADLGRRQPRSRAPRAGSCRRLLAAALRVREALPCRGHRLDVRRERKANKAFPAGADRDRLLWLGGDAACCCSPMSARPSWSRHLGRAVLPGRAAADLGRLGLVGLRHSAVVGAYFVLPHVTAAHRLASSIRRPATAIRSGRSMEAFMNGGLFGRGPGEGTCEGADLPDAHSDFIFAVAGEELGLIACLMILGLFASSSCAASRGLLRENSLFVVLAVGPGCWSSSACRPHQHGLRPAPHADQGHDPAVHQLRRLLAAGHWAWPWAWCWP